VDTVSRRRDDFAHDTRTRIKVASHARTKNLHRRMPLRPGAFRGFKRPHTRGGLQLFDLRQARRALAFVKAPDFRLLQGSDTLTDYQFGARRLHHLFCSTCGIGSYSRGRDPAGHDTFAINVRCLDGVDLDALTLTPFDGKSL
jgi:hypothetical protein